MKKLFGNLKFLWGMVLLFFVTGALAIFGLTKITTNAYPLIILMMASFILMAIFLQLATLTTMKRRRKKLGGNLITLENIKWSNLRQAMIKSSFIEHKTSFSFLYTSTKRNVAIKVNLVNNQDKYFNNTNDEKINVDFGKCTKFISFEIFKDPTIEQIKMIETINTSSDKMYYRSMYVIDETLYIPDYIYPEDSMIEEINNLEKTLRLDLFPEENL